MTTKTRLVRETSCVHGYFQDCTFLLDSGEPCPGGTSREVEVDWDAGTEAVTETYSKLGPSRFTSEAVSRAVIHAALGGGL